MNVLPSDSTLIPNIIFDEFMKELSHAEFKLLICILRKTYGIGKTRAPISLYEMEKMTTLSRSGLSGCLNTLVYRGYILRFKSKTPTGNNAINEYEIQGLD